MMSMEEQRIVGAFIAIIPSLEQKRKPLRRCEGARLERVKYMPEEAGCS
jgi:hypothetical protein